MIPVDPNFAAAAAPVYTLTLGQASLIALCLIGAAGLAWLVMQCDKDGNLKVD